MNRSKPLESATQTIRWDDLNNKKILIGDSGKVSAGWQLSWDLSDNRETATWKSNKNILDSAQDAEPVASNLLFVHCFWSPASLWARTDSISQALPFPWTLPPSSFPSGTCSVSDSFQSLVWGGCFWHPGRCWTDGFSGHPVHRPLFLAGISRAALSRLRFPYQGGLAVRKVQGNVPWQRVFKWLMAWGPEGWLLPQSCEVSFDLGVLMCGSCQNLVWELGKEPVICLTLSSERAGWSSEKYTCISMNLLEPPVATSVSRDSTWEDVPQKSLEPALGAQAAD